MILGSVTNFVKTEQLERDNAGSTLNQTNLVAILVPNLVVMRIEFRSPLRGTMGEGDLCDLSVVIIIVI